MIIFKTIKFKNFLSTGNIFSEIGLDEHQTTLIVGDNGAASYPRLTYVATRY